MLSNVKGQVSQMTSWVGSAIPSISGLRRGGEEMVPDPPEHLPPVADLKTDVESPASEKSVKGSPVEQQKEDDDSRYRYIDFCAYVQHQQPIRRHQPFSHLPLCIYTV